MHTLCALRLKISCVIGLGTEQLTYPPLFRGSSSVSLKKRVPKRFYFVRFGNFFSVMNLDLNNGGRHFGARFPSFFGVRDFNSFPPCYAAHPEVRCYRLFHTDSSKPNGGYPWSSYIVRCLSPSQFALRKQDAHSRSLQQAVRPTCKPADSSSKGPMTSWTGNKTDVNPLKSGKRLTSTRRSSSYVQSKSPPWGKCSWWKKLPWRRAMATISTEMGILGGMAFSTHPDPWFPKEPRTNFSASRMSLKWRLFETKRHLAFNSHPPNLSDTTKMGEVPWIHMHLHNQWTKVALSSLREIFSDIPPKSRHAHAVCFATQNFMCYRLRYGTVYISPSVPWVKQRFIEETGCFCFLWLFLVFCSNLYGPPGSSWLRKILSTPIW